MESQERAGHGAAEHEAAPAQRESVPQGQKNEPLSMFEAVGKLTPDQAGLLGVLLGLQRLGDD